MLEVVHGAGTDSGVTERVEVVGLWPEGLHEEERPHLSMHHETI